MERTEVLDMMSGLKLYGMRSAYDETLATALKRKHEPQRFVGDLLKAEISESVRKVYEGLQSLRSMRRMEASRRNASALSVRFSKSLARRRQRLSQARVRSTTHRIGSTSNPLALSDRFTISTASSGRRLGTAWANCGPW